MLLSVIVPLMPVHKIAVKVPGGKLIRLTVAHVSGRIQSIQLTGDFFVHPEHGVVELEASLKDSPLDEGELEARMNATVEKTGMQLVGFTPRDVAQAILQAVAGGKRE